jgi:DNA polymerase-3 subunit gamma/tau
MKIADTDVEEILGLVDRKYLFVLSEAVLQRDAGRCLTILKEAYLAGIDMKHFYQMMLKHFRNMLLVKIAAEASYSFDIAPEQISRLKDQVESVSRETLQRYLEILIKEEDSFRRSQEARMKLETVIVGLAYLEPIIPLSEIISTIEALEQKLSKGLPATAASIAPQPSTNKQVKEIPADYGAEINIADERKSENILVTPNKPTGDLATLGNNLKEFIKKENARLGAKIESAEILSYENGLLTLGFPKGYLFLENISEKTQKEQLQQIAGSFFSESVTLKIQINENQKINANGSNGRSKANGINEMKREAMNHPILQKVLDEFSDAHIVEIKPLTDQKQGG